MNYVYIIIKHRLFPVLCFTILFGFFVVPRILYRFQNFFERIGTLPSKNSMWMKKEKETDEVLIEEAHTPSIFELIEEAVQPESSTSQDVINDAVSALRNIGFTKKAAVVAVNNACINEKFDDPVVLVKATLSRSNV
tara:strand:+ start:228 stop:638 length:411 start_codon:yes stop_codon:yes gene_type:complete